MSLKNLAKSFTIQQKKNLSNFFNNTVDNVSAMDNMSEALERAVKSGAQDVFNNMSGILQAIAPLILPIISFISNVKRESLDSTLRLLQSWRSFLSHDDLSNLIYLGRTLSQQLSGGYTPVPRHEEMNEFPILPTYDFIDEFEEMINEINALLRGEPIPGSVATLL